MKITRIVAYRVVLPLQGGRYAWSDDKAIASYDTTLVRVDTDAGVTGWGEACQLGPAYLPAYAAGTRTGLAEIAPHLIGQDPRELEMVNQVMDMALKGHPYVKSAVDIACWDILGKVAGLPVSALLGGRFSEVLPLYRSVSQDTPEAMAAEVDTFRAQGFRWFQLKVGGDPDADIARIHTCAARLGRGEGLVCDANTGWSLQGARRVANAVQDLDVYLEQPCPSYEECLSVRRLTALPFVLDECMDSLAAVARAWSDGAMDAVNLKISRVGGLTRARQIRDFCTRLGIAVTLEDAGGGDVTAATVAHFAASTPPKYRLSVTSAYFKTSLRTAAGAPQLENGTMRCPSAPGLGVEPLPAYLDTPVLEVD